MSYDYREIEAIPLSEVDLTSGRKSLVTAVVTPLDAEKMLENNEKNRKINQNTVLRYALNMQLGTWDWCESDEPIKVGEHGVLRDGQHRLSAQVLANVVGVYDIRTGVPEESYKNMDSGLIRTAAAYFYAKERPKDVSALASRVLYASRGYIEPTSSMSGALNGVRIPTRNEIIEFTEENYEDLLWYIRQAARIVTQNKRGGASAYASALYISPLQKDDIVAFIDAYVEGDDDTGTTKQTILKKLLGQNFKPRPHWYGGVILMAYDAWEQGRGVKILRGPDVVKRYRSAVKEFSAAWNEARQ